MTTQQKKAIATDEQIKQIRAHLEQCDAGDVARLIADDCIIIGEHPAHCDSPATPFARGLYECGTNAVWSWDRLIVAPLGCDMPQEDIDECQKAQKDGPIDCVWVDYSKLQ